MRRIKNVALFVGLMSMLVLPALADRTVIRSGWNLFSPQQDVEMGRRLAGEAESILMLNGKPDPNTYIDALGQQFDANTWPSNSDRYYGNAPGFPSSRMLAYRGAILNFVILKI